MLEALRLRQLAPTWRSSLYTNSFYLMAANVINAAFGFLFWTLAARLYPPQEVGLAAAAVSAAGLVAMLAVLGLDHAVVRFLPRAADAPQGLINSSLTIGTAAPLALSLVFIAGLGLWSPALLPLRQSPVFVAGLTVAAVCATVSALLGGVFLARKRAELVFAQAAIFNITRVLFAVILVEFPMRWG
jgi:O-antigen/teichoic acid export membrane protein